MVRTVAQWIDARLHVSTLYASTAGHTVPASAASWFYVFGSGTLLCFVLQIVTGICLAFVYVPSADEAYTSLTYLNEQQTLGWFLRAIHYWGSNFMVGIMLVHMAQVLRFDQDAYWGLGIGASMMGRVPLIGANLVRLMLAGPIIAGETLSRFFTLHVFVIPGLILALVAVHLRLVLTKGINEYPEPGRQVTTATYDAEYEELLQREGVPFVPQAIGKDLIFSGLVILGILGCAASFGPKGPEGVPDPTYIRTVPRPDVFFLWLYAVLALLPDYLETFLI